MFSTDDIERGIRAQCVEEGKAAEERDRLVKWFASPRPRTVVEKTCASLVQTHGMWIHRTTMETAFYAAGGKTAPGNHMTTHASHRYGKGVTEYPPYIKQADHSYALNPTVASAVRWLIQQRTRKLTAEAVALQAMAIIF